MPPLENAGMEVRFTFSREDYLHYVDFWAKRHRRAQRRSTIRVFFLLFAGYVALSLLSNMPVGFAIALGAFLATVSVSLIHWMQRRRMRRVRKSALGERTTRIGPEGIFGKFSHFEILNHWQGITEIAETVRNSFGKPPTPIGTPAAIEAVCERRPATHNFRFIPVRLSTRESQACRS